MDMGTIYTLLRVNLPRPGCRRRDRCSEKHRRIASRWSVLPLEAGRRRPRLPDDHCNTCRTDGCFHRICEMQGVEGRQKGGIETLSAICVMQKKCSEAGKGRDSRLEKDLCIYCIYQYQRSLRVIAHMG